MSNSASGKSRLVYEVPSGIRVRAPLPYEPTKMVGRGGSRRRSAASPTGWRSTPARASLPLRARSARAGGAHEAAGVCHRGSCKHGHRMMTSPFFFRDRDRLAELALRHRLPSVFVLREHTDAGGLMSYSPSLTGMYRRTADYVDRIAKGARPFDLPVEQPTKFELILNLKTAKALGLTIPPTLLARADEVIE